MQYVDTIIKVGALITAIIIIWKAIKAVLHFNASLVEFRETVEDMKIHSKENYLAILRLTIMSPNMPIGERIASGMKYLELGGNGDVKKYLKEEFDVDETTATASHYKH